MKLSLPLVSAFVLPAIGNPIFGDRYHMDNSQNVLSSKFNHYHPLLDKYVNAGLFDKNLITPDISEAWELLENTVSYAEIEIALNQLSDSGITSKAPQSAVRIPNLVDTLNYDHVKLNDFESYGLRIKKHLDSDPSILGVDTVKQWTGYFDINDDDKHLFFWFFESRNDPVNDPVILWLNGGPGCSSMTGLFFELGPSSINGTTLKPVFNPYSWNSNASVIFLEQPVGVGYSYAEKSTVSSTQQAAEDVYAFLQLFFSKFITHAKNDFHIAGESYAGHYIPNIASVIANKEDKFFDLKSVMIGNGITDALIQYYYYIPMACNATESGYKQLISDEDCDKMETMYPRCAALINRCYSSQTALTCLPANLYCERMMGPFEKTGLNYYDIRKPCLGDGCYPQMSAIDEYLNLPEVMNSLGSEVKKYVGCDNQVFRNFILSGDEPKPFQQFVVEILELNIPVLLYAGDKDYICNWLGNKGWSNELPWSGKDSFTNATTTDWYSKIDGQHAGTVQSNGLLTFLRVFDAGHMVPFDQPSNSLDMLNRWVSGDYYFSK
jgi:cathepsin A (carboxypeptidase C)